MNELIYRKAVEHNDLINSVAKMNAVPLKIFSLAVSCIDTENPPENYTVYLSKKLLFSFLCSNGANKNQQLKSVMDELQKGYFEIFEMKEGGFKYRSIVPVPFYEWDDIEDDITIRFDVAIMPYLINLKNNFTQIDLIDLHKLKKKYSVVLYKWLIMNYNQYENYKSKGNRTKKQLDQLKNPVMSVKDLRRITVTEDIYERFFDFEKKVLEIPLAEINQHTKLNVSYKKIKGSKYITEIHFHIDKKPVVKNEFYKEEQQDPAYFQEKEDEEREFETSYGKAVESAYTEVLGENMLIGFKDIRDKQLMASLQKTVYPLYDELERLKGMGSVKQHISYVASKKKDYSKKNIVKYLHESIQNYLPRAGR